MTSGATSRQGQASPVDRSPADRSIGAPGGGTTPSMDFSEVTRLLDPAMYVVTADDGSERSGCLIAFATQCSIHPPRFLVCLSVLNHTERVARRAKALAVHLLDTHDHPLAAHFGGLTGDETDKFAGVAWHHGVLGTPVLDDAPAAFEGLVLERHVLGDHVGYVLDPEAEEAKVAAPGLEPFRLHGAADIRAGHPPDERREG